MADRSASLRCFLLHMDPVLGIWPSSWEPQEATLGPPDWRELRDHSPMTLRSGGNMSQSSAWSYLAPCQLLTTCEEPVGPCQALGNYLPWTWTPTSQNSVYLGSIPCPWGIHLSSLTSWDFTPENLHGRIPLDVMLDSYKHFRYSFLSWAIPKPAVFLSQVTDVGGRHRERGGQEKQIQLSLISLLLSFRILTQAVLDMQTWLMG